MKVMKVNQFPLLDYFTEEAIDRLRVNVGFTGMNKKVIMITSSVPNEGKSYVSANLWRQLAMAGKRTVLVDADMRKTEMRSTLRLTTDNEFAGLSHYLAGQASIEDILYATNQANAYIIPTTTLINPSLLLEGDRLQVLLQTLRERFDYILVDTPPLGVVSDGQRFATMCDGCLLVIRAHSTSRSLIKESLAQLERVNCPLIGPVLNRVEEKRSTYYHAGGYYSKRTKYYYASDSAKKGGKKEEAPAKKAKQD